MFSLFSVLDFELVWEATFFGSKISCMHVRRHYKRHKFFFHASFQSFYSTFSFAISQPKSTHPHPLGKKREGTSPERFFSRASCRKDWSTPPSTPLLSPTSRLVIIRYHLYVVKLHVFYSFPGNPCPNGWTRFNNYCYLVSTTSTYSWSQAQAHCRSLSADLVKINSAEENEFVLSLVRKLAPSLKQIWIGLKWNTNGFYWIDLSVPVYKSWAPQHPNGNANEPCVQMWINNGQHLPKYASGYWNDIDCHYRSDFPNGIVCKKLP